MMTTMYYFTNVYSLYHFISSPYPHPFRYLFVLDIVVTVFILAVTRYVVLLAFIRPASYTLVIFTYTECYNR